MPYGTSFGQPTEQRNMSKNDEANVRVCELISARPSLYDSSYKDTIVKEIIYEKRNNIWKEIVIFFYFF